MTKRKNIWGKEQGGKEADIRSLFRICLWSVFKSLPAKQDRINCRNLYLLRSTDQTTDIGVKGGGGAGIVPVVGVVLGRNWTSFLFAQLFTQSSCQKKERNSLDFFGNFFWVILANSSLVQHFHLLTFAPRIHEREEKGTQQQRGKRRRRRASSAQQRKFGLARRRGGKFSAVNFWWHKLPEASSRPESVFCWVWSQEDHCLDLHLASEEVTMNSRVGSHNSIYKYTVSSRRDFWHLCAYRTLVYVLR